MCSYNCSQLPNARWGIFFEKKLLATIEHRSECELIVKGLKLKSIHRFGASRELRALLQGWANTPESDLLTWMGNALATGTLTAKQYSQLEKLEHRYRLSLQPEALRSRHLVEIAEVAAAAPLSGLKPPTVPLEPAKSALVQNSLAQNSLAQNSLAQNSIEPSPHAVVASPEDKRSHRTEEATLKSGEANRLRDSLKILQSA